MKTRLAKDVGPGRAAAVFRTLIKITLAQAEGPWRTVIAVDQQSDLYGWRHLWPGHLPRVAQSGRDLGARLRRAIGCAPRGPVVVIGADAPRLRSHHIRDAFGRLGRVDAVFGPALDGGYWLIGLARRRSALTAFDGVRWSSKHALKDTLRSLPPNFETSFLSMQRDVDDANDLAALQPLVLSDARMLTAKAPDFF